MFITGEGAATVGNVKALVKKRRVDYEKRCNGVKYEEHTIFRVPRNLREVGGKAYIPQMISIGPYHYGNRRLEDMQKHKLRLLYRFLDRTNVDFDVCIQTMIDLEQKLRKCYVGLADNEAINSNEFAEMMLLDACFILELFDQHFKRSRQSGCLESDPLFSPRAFIPCIRRDLLMLENQIPLVVLESLFDLVLKKNGKENMTSPKKNDKETVASLALHFFMPAIESTEVEMERDVKPLTCSMCLQSGSHRDTREIGIEVNNGNDVGIQGNNSNSTKQLHLLHIIQQSLLPQMPIETGAHQIPNDSHRPHSMTHCVSMLRDHGVKFEPKWNSTRITDISFFKGGRLQIPQLVINDSTRSILLNLMAFEQCYSQCGNHVTSYVNFMDGLINGPKDVSYLHHMKIIVHRLGSEEAVARLVNQLCREMAFDTDDNGKLSLVSKEIDQFIQKRRHKWWASLKHEYLRHPWAIISICAAMFLVGLTVMGTLYAILSFHIHRS